MVTGKTKSKVEMSEELIGYDAFAMAELKGKGEIKPTELLEITILEDIPWIN